MAEWRVVLDGVTLTGGVGATGHGNLTQPPAGLGQPGRRTEDVTYPQRDGVRHFADWYEPRIITLEDVWVTADGCPGCPSVREKAGAIMAAWSRRCDDAELVLFTDCHDPDGDRTVVGPFSVIGRPRVAEVEWATGGIKAARLTLRFDSPDHRIYVLDADGEPGSGEQCVTLTPTVDVFCRSYDRCYSPSGMCYDTDMSPSGGGPETLAVSGNICVHPTITLTGPLTNPVIENLTSGETLTYGGQIEAGDVIVIDTNEGTATTSDGASRTSLLSGATRMQLILGDNTLRLISFGSTDTGTAEVCWRNQVDWA